MNSILQDLYERIGLPRNASREDIEQACLRLADKYRPDLHPGDPVAAAKFAQIEAAYATLTEPTRRTAYDKQFSHADTPVAGDLRRSEHLSFTGTANEYFRIWIVNLALSILTLGIYSAWAKVRRKKYFYGNTLLNDAAFEYIADPKAILKGRLIVVTTFVVLSLLEKFSGTNLFWIVYLGVLPYVVIKAGRFNATNSAFRNVRFRFGIGFPPQTGWSRRYIAGYNKTSQFLILPLILVPLSLGLLYPYYVYRKRQFILEHSAYGMTPFAFDAHPGAFYFAYFKAALLFLLFLAGSVVTIGIGALPLYILFAAHRDAAVGRLSWKHASLGDLRFNCHWRTWDLFKLHLLNSLAIIFTLGLMVPWAAIRTARYELQGLSIGPIDAVDGFVAAAQEQVSATGGEAGELLGFDFGL